jgi:hypothetical protein
MHRGGRPSWNRPRAGEQVGNASLVAVKALTARPRTRRRGVRTSRHIVPQADLRLEVVFSEAARKILKGQLETDAIDCECSVADGRHQHVPQAEWPALPPGADR